MRRRADDDPTTGRRGLQPGGEVHDVTGDERLPARRVGIEVDESLGGGDADARLQGLVADGEFGHRLLDA